MPVTTAHESRTSRLEILDEGLNVDRSLLPDLSADQLLDLYKSMVLMRRLDEKALKLQRQGRLSLWASLRGQEAAQAGLGFALRTEDWLVPTYRDHGLLLAKGVPAHLVVAFWRGDERGARVPDDVRVLPPSVPIASQLLHGVGLGWALRQRNDEGVAVSLCGDGATSQGDFHEALNFAAVFDSRSLFFVQNNSWAISVPVSKQTRSATLAQKAFAHGVEGVQVDGNDVLAVYAAAVDALDHVRAGKGPRLIEAVTYRLSDHTTADDATRYRSTDELALWEKRDPVTRMRGHLVREGLLEEAHETQIDEWATRRVDEAVRSAESMPPPKPEDIFDSMFAELPLQLAEQRRGLLEEVEDGRRSSTDR